MKKLTLKSNLKTLYIVGDFNNWDINNPVVAKAKKGEEFASCRIPSGDYKVLKAKGSWLAQEVNQENNRYKNDVEDEEIEVQF